MTKQERICANKIQYESWVVAAYYARRSVGAKAYKCPHCGKFHLTVKKKVSNNHLVRLIRAEAYWIASAKDGFFYTVVEASSKKYFVQFKAMYPNIKIMSLEEYDRKTTIPPKIEKTIAERFLV